MKAKSTAKRLPEPNGKENSRAFLIGGARVEIFS
jgi:hypothetical protein